MALGSMFGVRGSDHVGNDLFGLSSFNTHVYAQELPNEYVGSGNDTDQTTLSPSSSQAMEQRFERPFGPPPMIISTCVHQISHGRQSILLRQHPEDGETMCFIVCKQNRNRPGNVPHLSSGMASSTVLSTRSSLS